MWNYKETLRQNLLKKASLGGMNFTANQPNFTPPMSSPIRPTNLPAQVNPTMGMKANPPVANPANLPPAGGITSMTTPSRPPNSGIASTNPTIGSPPKGSSPKPRGSDFKTNPAKVASFNDKQLFALGFLKKATDQGIKEEDAIDLLKLSAFAPEPSMFNTAGSNAFKMKSVPSAKPMINPSMSGHMAPQGNPNPISQIAKQTPPALQPVQPNPAAMNPAGQDFQQFETAQNMQQGANPVINNQVDHILSSLPPLQAQELIRYLQAKQLN